MQGRPEDQAHQMLNPTPTLHPSLDSDLAEERIDQAQPDWLYHTDIDDFEIEENERHYHKIEPFRDVGPHPNVSDGLSTMVI